MTDNPANCERVKTPLKHTPTKEVVSDDLGYGKERRVSFVTPFGGYHKAMEKHLCLRLCQARIWLKRRGHGGCSYFEQSSATQLGDAKSMGGQMAILMVFPAGRLAARLPSVSGRVGDERCQVDRSPCCNASTTAMPSAQGFRGRKAEERLTD